MLTLLHFSTDEVYGDIAEGAHIETDLLKHSNPYSASKAAADMLILAWARTFKVPYVIVRRNKQLWHWSVCRKTDSKEL